MFTEAFPQLKNSRVVRFLHEFFRSPYYCALAVLLMVCSELFSLELAVFYCYLFFGAVACLFDEDTIAVVPLACCGYMTISAANNVGKYPETAMLKQPLFTMHFIFIFSTAAVLLFGRLIIKLLDREKRSTPKLTYGIVLLGAAYLAAGLFSGSAWLRSALFGAAQMVSLALGYFYFYYSVDWETVPKHYFVWFMTILGVGMAAEVLGMYALPGVLVDGATRREAMFTGWGIYNNVGCMMAMCMPAPFYFAATKKHGWAYAILGIFFMLAVALTQSRGAMLFGAVVFVICLAVALFCAKGKERLWILVVYAAFAVALAICLIVFREKLKELFRLLIAMGSDSSGRTEIYRACWEKFLQSPMFGVGFYETPGGMLHDGDMLVLTPTPEGVFIPPRAHNTFFQLLASGGVFALLAYLFHRIQTLVLVFKKVTLKKVFLGLCCFAMLLTSLVDCHFFNFGPVILYSVILVFIECELLPAKPLSEKA